MDELEPKKTYEENVEVTEPEKSGVFLLLAKIVAVTGTVSAILAALAFIGLVVVIGIASWLVNNQGGIKPPYNAIDFQQVGYIDNQFVIYGIDYDKHGLDGLVIFNSVDGESWDKSKISIANNNQGVHISYQAVFSYFKGKCYLIGATVQPLVADDCKSWYSQNSNVESNPNESYPLSNGVSGATVWNENLYVSTKNGVYSTPDGVKWQHELMPYPSEVNPDILEFGSIAASHDKLITETYMGYKKKTWGLIYTKDLKTNSWSYQVYPETVHNITRGKDRFVGLTETSSLVLVDANNEWESYPISHHSLSMSFGLKDTFVAVGGIQSSSDGGRSWLESDNSNKGDIWGLVVACSEFQCVGIGDNYHLITTNDGISWKLQEFEQKNPPRKLGWYDRLLNRIFFTKN